MKRPSRKTSVADLQVRRSFAKKIADVNVGPTVKKPFTAGLNFHASADGIDIQFFFASGVDVGKPLLTGRDIFGAQRFGGRDQRPKRRRGG